MDLCGVKHNQLQRQSFMHLPLRKQIILRIQQSAGLENKYGLADAFHGLVIDTAAPAAKRATEAKPDDRLTCPVCYKRFASASKHRAHEQRHRSKLLGHYRCAECAKCFVQKSSLDTHRRSHTGERPYRCQHCRATFGDVSCYNKHKLVHSGDRPYTCFACDKSFTQSGNLYRHMRSCVLAQNNAPSPL